MDTRASQLTKQVEKQKLERIHKRDVEIQHLNEKKQLETTKFEEKEERQLHNLLKVCRY